MAHGRIAARLTALALLSAALAAAPLVTGLAEAGATEPKPATTPKTTRSRIPAVWKQLRPDQQRVLAPLKDDWENLEPVRKLKWIEIANRYPKLPREDQARIQEKMKAWASLTPEQRRAAREFYQDIEKLPPEKKQEVRQKWEEYQQLPEGKRQELAARPKQAEEPVPAHDSH